MKGMKAWLITWDGTHVPDQARERVVAILNSRMSPEKVREMTEFLYVNAKYSLAERASYAKSKKNNPYPAEWEKIRGVNYLGRITCGHNPWLYARQVKNLKIERDSESGEEQVSWDEFPLPDVSHIFDNS